jgi:hypothetical protein
MGSPGRVDCGDAEDRQGLLAIFENLTKAEASKRIDALKEELGIE